LLGREKIASIKKRPARSGIARSCREIGTASDRACRSSRAGLFPALLISSYGALYTCEGHNYPQEDEGSALNILALAPRSIADLSLSFSFPFTLLSASY